MLREIAVGLGMVVLTTMIHALFMISGNLVLEWHLRRFGPLQKHFAKAATVSALTAWQLVAVIVEGFIWAVLYLKNPLITSLPDIETAFYFSMVTFTTLGYGDVVLTGSWRMLASLQSANGVIIFGWSTALIFYYIQRTFGRRE